MYINLRAGIGRRQLDIFVKRLARHVGERRGNRLSVACMAPGAKVDLPLARKSGGVKYGWAGGCFRVGTLSFDVFASRSMAFFTGDSHYKIVLNVSVQEMRDGLKVSRMTLKTPWNDWPLEIYETIAIAGAVHPSKLPPIRNRQLKKPIASPVQVGLSFPTGTDHEAKFLGVRFGVRRYTLHRRLEKTGDLRFHPEQQLRIRGLEHIGAGREVS